MKSNYNPRFTAKLKNKIQVILENSPNVDSWEAMMQLTLTERKFLEELFLFFGRDAWNFYPEIWIEFIEFYIGKQKRS